MFQSAQAQKYSNPMALLHWGLPPRRSKSSWALGSGQSSRTEPAQCFVRAHPDRVNSLVLAQPGYAISWELGL
jgi:hypothetical protein